ncbi:TIGR03986 family CRISPR-associated RAMP protein [Clostridium sp. WLY-B-L2]|uniref:TIGR03986 family CRISPR-associated RAMP protein n=1 Tax=Clostridium aromativorans TaxID=2836848 RepID=A0ABS8N6Y8_9CLOT|nr:TIGR03986 family CRISPR-associated RAMP protein [Clostridium aromativorans]MCC9294929.1 TIGR03986 family CRISPR-associated RAMP protein [Clostridium aromativorans]
MGNRNYSIIRDHSVAPYNFVSLPNKCVFPYKTYKDLPGHDILNESYLNGYIEYEIVNETPLIVGSSERNQGKVITPFKNPQNKYVIPGNTIRGILRNNTAFLSLSSLEDFIENDRFYFRSFGKGKDRENYKNRLSIGAKVVNGESTSMPRKINGGYIYKDSRDKYVLVPSKKVGNNDLSYFVISEQYLRSIHPDVGEDYMYNSEILDLIRNKAKYKSQGYRPNQNKKQLLKNRNDEYKPYYVKISFEIKGVRTVSKIGKPGEYKNQGYLMSSEFIQGKLAHYVIPEPDFDSPDKIGISRDNGGFKFIDFYKNDLLRTKKQRDPGKIDKKKDKTYFFLPDKEGRNSGKPIFYYGKFNKDNNKFDKLYFGFSPYLRIPYDYSIKDLMPEGYKDKSGFSYVDALFGFTERGKEKRNYKGRLSFEDVVCASESPKLCGEYRLVAGEPHASSYPSYLKQDIISGKEPMKIKNYNDSDSQIRGIKEYLNRDNDTIDDTVANANENVNGKVSENVSVYIRPLSPKTVFKGKIYFNNLTREELGLISWALKVKGGAYETIGYGKPYGFGRVKVENINIKTEDIHKKYSSMTADYYRKENREVLIDEYKKSFKERFNIDIDLQAAVKDFIILKTLVVDKNHENEARYMKIKFYPDRSKSNEFNMLKPLPDPEKLRDILK